MPGLTSWPGGVSRKCAAAGLTEHEKAPVGPDRLAALGEIGRDRASGTVAGITAELSPFSLR